MTKKPQVGIGVLIFNDQHELLLGKRAGSHGKLTYAPPGGHLEFGESLEACTQREVLEETGLFVQNPEFLAITNDVFAGEEKHYISIFMHVRLPLNQNVQNCEPHKTESWHWFPLSQLPSPLFLPLQQLLDQKGYGLGLY